MAIRLSVLNFRNLRDVLLDDPCAVSVVVGNNEAGKTSLMSSIMWVLLNEAYGLKGKEGAAELISYGETRMSVELQVGAHRFTRSRTSGDSIKSVSERLGIQPDLLPLVLNAKLNGDGGNKHMKAFLSGSAEARFDASVHFVNNPAVKSCVDTARNAGCTTTKQIVKYCTDLRATCQTPQQPTTPTCPEPTQQQIDEARKVADACAARVQEAQTELDDFIRISRGFTLVNEFLVAEERYKVDLKASAQGDPLKDRRQDLDRLTKVPDHTLLAVVELLNKAGYAAEGARLSEAISSLRSAQADAKRRLTETPAPPNTPAPPILPDDAQLAFQALKSGNQLSLEGVRTALAGTANISSSLRAKLADTQTAKVRATGVLDDLMRNSGAWSSYRNAVPAWEEAKLKAAADWARWDHAEKAILEAETDHINKAGISFGGLVTKLGAAILGGRQIRINRDEGIFLGKDNIEQCSDSTRWRMEVAIMAAVGITLNSPILLIDGADILDPANTSGLTQFVQEHIVPHFKHIIVNRTPRGSIDHEYQVGPQMTKWLLRNGELKRAPAVPPPAPFAIG